MKNLVVVGGSYVGLSTASELAKAVPEGHRIVVVEKNSHFGHLFAYPRFAVAPEHEHKAFIPFTKSLQAPHRVVQARATGINGSTLTLDRAVELDEGSPSKEIPFEALVLATGTHLASPGTLPLNIKQEGVDSLRSFQKRIEAASSILILGGGAVGVQLATDLGCLYPDKEITLLHSRQQLMPRFHPELSNIIMKRFKELGVKTILGSRAIVPENGWPTSGRVTVTTQDGRSVETDLVLQSTGQAPNSHLLESFAPSAIASNGFIKVQPTLQIDAQGVEGSDRVFAVGDIADTGAPKAARPALAAAAIVAGNVLQVVQASQEPLQTYDGKASPAAIHLTLGIKESVIFRNPDLASQDEKAAEPMKIWKDDGKLDMGIEGVWARRAPGVTDFWA